MARPTTSGLTNRELKLMHLFWRHGEQTAIDARQRLADAGIDRAYVTVANLIRILTEKQFLKAVNNERPFRYVPTRSFKDVSSNLVRDLIHRVFLGSREQLLVHIMQAKKLTTKERTIVQSLLTVDKK